jgi:hypothetical protein
MLKQLFMSSAVMVVALIASANGQELASRNEPSAAQTRVLQSPPGDAQTGIPASVDGDDAVAAAIFAAAGRSRPSTGTDRLSNKEIDPDDAVGAAIFAAAGRALGTSTQIGLGVSDFKANFDFAAQALRPASLAPGSAEIP